MRAMVFRGVGKALTLEEVAMPEVAPHEVLIKVHSCALCRTDLHIIEGELKEPKLPLILGHQIVGTIKKIGSKVRGLSLENRIGIPWFQKSCMECEYCTSKRENLCDKALFTGYHIDGGFAEYCVVDALATYPIPPKYDDLHAAPLLCAGMIGYRAYKAAGKVRVIALYGFGSSAHILTQLLTKLGITVYVFTHKGDKERETFAKELGATWVGSVGKNPPTLVDAALIFAPVGSLIVDALKIVKKGGSVISAGIYMSDLPSFPYELLWGERRIASVANLTRKDGEEFMELATKIDIQTHVKSYRLEEANEALADLKKGIPHSPSFVLKVSY